MHHSSSSELRRIADQFSMHLALLYKLGINTDQMGMFIIHMASKCLDLETRKLWESQLEAKQIPTWDNMAAFLNNRAHVLIAVEFGQQSDVSQPGPTGRANVRNTKTLVASNYNQSCIMCAKDHELYNCKTFLDLNVSDRLKKLKEHRLCFNCLKKDMVRVVANQVDVVCVRVNTIHYCILTIIHIKSLKQKNRRLESKQQVITHQLIVQHWSYKNQKFYCLQQ